MRTKKPRIQNSVEGLLIFGLTLAVFVVIFTLLQPSDNVTPIATPTPDPCAAGAVQVTIAFSLNDQQNYMTPAIDRFNGAYAAGRNPMTGQPLTSRDPRICVLGQNLRRSSDGAEGIVNAVIAPNHENVMRPTMFGPAVSTWLGLVNYRSGHEVFNLSEAQPIALTPVVMAIWESRLEAIQQTVGREDIGWADLLAVLNAPNGWRDYGIADGRRAVYYGHTDPRRSSTALSAVIAEFYVAARNAGHTERRLTSDMVLDPAVLGGVRQIEQLIRHYSTNVDDFLAYIAQGPDYVDFVALEEIDVLFINGAFAAQGFAPDFRPPEPLVALYPREGTVWHERPVGIPNGDRVTAEQREAAHQFIAYLLAPETQSEVLAYGFRPVNDDIAIGYPFVEANGVTPAGPPAILDMPDPETVIAIQQNWSLVKKQADVMLLVDVSGSMNEENKIGQAIQGALEFVEGMEDTSRVGLAVFSDSVRLLQPVTRLESSRAALVAAIQNLRADGGTELYAAVRDTVTYMNDLEDSDRIRAVVLLSDGQDTGEQGVTIGDAIQAITASQDDDNPVIVVPLAYGSSPDTAALNDMARASSTIVQEADPDNIQELLNIIRSYFD